ncbi:unnamed protein product [Periconia digitata]|uniref:Uncharacterized protein n=1 Tax=Periconia digitata TaxID=1303443 RepID=A0A9W4UHB0_9PLEO|nr:unnamed protein product [Periconia digitata]
MNTSKPADPTSSSQTFQQRTCPNMRSCWNFSYHSFSLRTSDRRTLYRRISMIVILLTRLALSIISIFFHLWGGELISVIVGSILTVLGFLFVAWCLTVIGEAQGGRKVMGLMIRRGALDIFLWIVAEVHVALLIIGAFFGFGNWMSITWTVMWLVIFGAAWVCTWTPDEAESQV